MNLNLVFYVFISVMHFYIFIHIYIYLLYIHWLIRLVGRVFANLSGRLRFNSRSRHTKDFKNGAWYLLPRLRLSNIKYVSRVKWSIQRNGVAIENRAS